MDNIDLPKPLRVMLQQFLLNNSLKSWNVFSNQYGQLVCNIKFDICELGHSDTKHIHVSAYRRVSDKQQARNANRVNNHKKRKLNPSTPEDTWLNPTTHEDTRINPTTLEDTRIKPTTPDHTRLNPTTHKDTWLKSTTPEGTRTPQPPSHIPPASTPSIRTPELIRSYTHSTSQTEFADTPEAVAWISNPMDKDKRTLPSPPNIYVPQFESLSLMGTDLPLEHDSHDTEDYSDTDSASTTDTQVLSLPISIDQTHLKDNVNQLIKCPCCNEEMTINHVCEISKLIVVMMMTM